MTSESPVPVTTSPVLTPIRTGMSTASRSSWAARTARSASSSRIVGTPKTAITASPMNFSTVPPCRSIAARAASKYRVITARTASGSRDSANAVEPETSQKSTVTSFRCSRAGTSASAAPHESQKRAPSRFSAPQLAHVMDREVRTYPSGIRPPGVVLSAEPDSPQEAAWQTPTRTRS